MRDNKLTVQINKPVNEVFEFTLNPSNTPLWVDSIVFEETNEKPTQMGTIYRNKNQKGEWTEYIVTDYKENEFFILTLTDKNYNVKYTFKSIDNATELEYYEWVNQGDLKEPFSLSVLQKLKLILES